MRRDIRDTPSYKEAEELNRKLRSPGTGQISDAREINVSPDGKHALFTGVIVDALDGSPPTRICQVDLTSGETRVLTFGPNVDRLPKYSPDGKYATFLSDRHQQGDLQLYLLDLLTGAARPTPRVQGWVEYQHWSLDGRYILLGVAGHGADLAAGGVSKKIGDTLPSWMPTIDSGNEEYRWRSLWLYAVATNTVSQISAKNMNIWEAAWCGTEAVTAVASSGPGEGLWYNASLYVIDIRTGDAKKIYAPQNQLGLPAGSPSGKHLAVVKAICSDRWYVAGNLLLIDTNTGETRKVDTDKVDITYTEWRSNDRLLVAGHREFETVVGIYDILSGIFNEVWSSKDVSSGIRYISVSGLNDSGDCVLVAEGFFHAPEIALIRAGAYKTVKSFDVGYADEAKVIDAVDALSWRAPDGLEIQGLLLRPKGKGPFPMIVNVHGGPVGHWRPLWLGRWFPEVLALLKRGYAVFHPNPRGSSGRGQDFARGVLGDMGGADTYDFLSGIDYLVAQGIADPKRIGVWGISYGGYMTSWLITQDSRFAAAVSVSPVTNQVTQHLISNIPEFVALFLADTYTNPGGKYFQRSPIMHAHKVKTPTLNICGGMDRITPPSEATQFHNALLENSVKSVLLNYPTESHGIGGWPAGIDCAARMLAWFDEHMPAEFSPTVTS